ncbi:DNA polymerase III subunit epsilon [Castellaniella sp.]|uniref:DNA polymerase III subunit epsilon n=1 Tax=Castellaniella sp. TaxID=1955812 RepID=UPI003568FED3
MRQVIMDTETTGLDPDEGHRIVELGCVEIINRRITRHTLHLYLNPDRDSDPGALQVHGLTTEFLSEHPRFPEVAHQLVDFVRGAEVIIHNAPFDVKFLDAELARAGQPRFAELCDQITDSLQVARDLFPGKRNNLDALCERFGVSNAHRTLHGALLDSELLGEVWLAMTRGQDSLLEGMAEVDGHDAHLQRVASGRIDAGRLQVIALTDHDLAAHEAYLDALEKDNGKPSLWRSLEAR